MNRFETEIAKSFRVVKDSNLPEGLECPFEYTRLVVNKQASYGITTPCDALVDVYQCQCLALELKEQQKREAFKIDRVPDHQIAGLRRFSLLGRKSYLLICFRHWQLPEKDLIGLKPLQKREAQKRRAYALDINLFLQLKEKNNTRSSIPVQDIEDHGIRLQDSFFETTSSLGKKVKIPTWDILPLIK
jgi:penicillin-binding protein-related factor A (putative recombinase)